MVLAIEIDNATMANDLIELEDWSEAAVRSALAANDFDNEIHGVEVRANVILVGHEEGVLVYVRQD